MSDWQMSLLTFAPWGVVAVGWAWLWHHERWQQDARHSEWPSDRRRSQGNRLGARCTLLLGLVAVVLSSLWVMAIVAVPLVLWLMWHAWRSYREGEQRVLLWCLAVAAERGIPLDSAARAFAGERQDRIGRRAASLAEYLEACVPLGLALERSGHSLNNETFLAASLGYQTGTLDTALRQVCRRDNEPHRVGTETLGRLVYLGSVAFVMGVLFTFLQLNTHPKLRQILFDFGIDWSTVLPFERWVGLELEPVVWGALLLVMAVGCLAQFVLRGKLARRLPMIRSIWWRHDCSLVMRWLALAPRRQKSLLEMTRLLAGYFPSSGMRRTLERAAGRMESGVPWTDSLVRANVFRSAEASAFRAAEKSGNLAWVLEEMAKLATTRWLQRVRVIAELAFPGLLLVLAGCTVAIVLQTFLPLVRLISEN